MTPSSTSPRRTQEQRSADTRRRLLDATVASLAEHGYAATTTTAVAARAGVSRGAQVHHFGSKEQLVIAAMAHLRERRLAAVRRAVEALPEGPDRAPAALRRFADWFTTPLFAASVELWVAARGDENLRAALVPVEAELASDFTDVCRSYITDDEVLARMTVEFLMGRGLANIGFGTASDTEAETTLQRWEALLFDHPMTPPTHDEDSA